MTTSTTPSITLGNTALELTTSSILATGIDESYKPIVEVIVEALPQLQKGTANFCKSQSQFMDNVLTVSGPTPLRNLRQQLAEIEQAMNALNEARFKVERTVNEIQDAEEDLALLDPEADPDIARARYDLECLERDDAARYLTDTTRSASDLAKRELQNKIDTATRNLRRKRRDLQLAITEKTAGLEVSKRYVEGAIRRVANHVEQYKTLLNSLGITEYDEVDFEQQEERYHIMTAFSQSITAARSHGGMIDEGDQIYLFQLGINGGLAQHYVQDFLVREREMIAAAVAKEMEIADYLARRQALLEQQQALLQEIDNVAKSVAATTDPEVKKLLADKKAQHDTQLGEVQQQLLAVPELVGDQLRIEIPAHGMVLDFLNRMADTFAGCSRQYQAHKGMSVSSEVALVKLPSREQERQQLMAPKD